MTGRSGPVPRRLPFLPLAGALLLALGAAADEPLPEAEALDLGGLEARSAALILSDQEAGALGTGVLAVPLPGTGGSSRVLLALDVPTATFREHPVPADVPLLEIYVYALDRDDAVLAALSRAVLLDAAAARRLPESEAVRFHGQLDLPPGEVSLRILVLHRASLGMSLSIVGIDVPAWPGEGQLLLPPLPMEPAAGRILVRDRAEPDPIVPLRIGGVPLIPAIRPPTDGRSPTVLLVPARHPAPDTALRLFEEAGASREARGGAPEPFGAGLVALPFEVDLAGLGPGSYRLVATAPPDRRAERILEVLPPPVPVPRPPEEPETRPELPRRTRAREDRVAQGYRRAAEALAAGDEEGAARLLGELETAALGDGARERQEILLRAELLAAVELAAGSAEPLWPLVGLHEAAYRRAHQRREYQRSTHARQMMNRLIELCLEADRSKAAQTRAASAFVGVGGYLQLARASRSARPFYERALALDRAHPAALLGLATIAEAHGDAREAADVLERLLEAAPGDPEARLRLAVNLRRLGRERRARELFTDLLDVADPDWIGPVAAQELARQHTAEGRREEAIRILRDAVSRRPEVSRLRLQLASLLDRSGRPDEAGSVVEEIDAERSRDVDSPRLRYSEVPTARLDETRRTLAAELADRRSDLARALAAFGGSGAGTR